MVEDDVVYEMEALQSIYAEDFEEKPDVWGNPSFAIKVKPQAEDGVSCGVTLVVTLNKSYPKVIPRCELEDISGLDDEEVKELKTIITTTAEENIGEVMIHEIVSQIETYLYAHNTNPANTKTFYEKMQTRKKLEETALDDLRSGRVLEEDDLDSESGIDSRRISSRSEQERETSTVLHTSEELKRRTDSRDQLDLPNLRGRVHSGERSVSLGEENSAAVGKVPTTATGKKSWDVENKNEFDESNSEGGETWLTELLKHKISENLMEYDDDLDDDDEENENNQQQQQQQLLLLQQQKQQGVEGGSRYHKEFQEMHLLGKGGGGEVWKVKNNLDRRAYAVKKILLNPTDKASNNRIRREVTTISSLLHKHIVRYYAAWVEKLTIPAAEEDVEDDWESGGMSTARDRDTDTRTDQEGMGEGAGQHSEDLFPDSEESRGRNRSSSGYVEGSGNRGDNLGRVGGAGSGSPAGGGKGKGKSTTSTTIMNFR